MKTIIIAICSILIWTVFTEIHKTKKQIDYFHVLETNKTNQHNPHRLLPNKMDAFFSPAPITKNRPSLEKSKRGRYLWSINKDSRKSWDELPLIKQESNKQVSPKRKGIKAFLKSEDSLPESGQSALPALVKNKKGQLVWDLRDRVKTNKGIELKRNERNNRFFPLLKSGEKKNKEQKRYFPTRIKDTKGNAFLGLTRITLKNRLHLISSKIKAIGLWLIQEQFHLLILLILYLINKYYNKSLEEGDLLNKNNLPFFLLRNG